MKRFAILVATVGLISGPAFAQQTQLEKSVDIPANSLSTAELVQLRFAMEEGAHDGVDILVRKIREAASVAVTREAR